MAYYQGAADKKVFLFVYSNMMPPQMVTNYLDTRPEILHWFAIFPNAILSVSRGDASTVKEAIHLQFPRLLFMVAEIDRNKINGWMNSPVWDFINVPKSSGRWEPPG